MLVASRPVDLLDRYRVPYRVERQRDDGVIRIARDGGDGPELIAVAPSEGAIERLSTFDGCTFFAALAGEAAVAEVLAATGRDWHREAPVVDASGTEHAVVRRSSRGDVCLPFDFDSALDALLSERYLAPARRAAILARRAYYRARPYLPRAVQLAFRRRAGRRQDRATFPAWPVETSLHRLEALVLRFLEELVGEPLPWLAPWPSPYAWAVILTHDVERAVGYANVERLRAVEARYGLRSAWYFVPERDYRVEESVLDRLRSADCEICLHGLRHDGRDLSAGTFEERLPAMRRYAERWGARGFRGPSTHRDRDRLQLLGVDHDSSWSDVARYEPQPGGCCSWLPFFIGETVEIPITMPQDHTLFELHGEATEGSWLAKVGLLREHGGMAVMLTHPDYLRDRDRLAAYERFLAGQAGDASAWHALPHEVADWWRRRAMSHLEREDGTWTVVGPAAAEARLRLGAPALPPVSGAFPDRSSSLPASAPAQTTRP